MFTTVALREFVSTRSILGLVVNYVVTTNITTTLHSKDDKTNKKMTKSSNNKIACIFEDISVRTHVN